MAPIAVFLVRRLAQGAVILLLVTSIIFTVLRVIPGDPVRLMAGPTAAEDTVERMARELGLRDPIPVQYVRYIAGVLRGDLGTSFVRPRSGQTTGGGRADDPTRADRAEALQLILDRMPLTGQLAGVALGLTLLLALPLGVASGVYRGRWPDTLAFVICCITVSLPNFWLGLALTLLLSIHLGWLPAVGYRGVAYTILPAIVLAIELAPILIRAIGLALAGALREGYAQLGPLRGLSRRRVLWAHAARNAAVPVLNMLGLQVATLLGGVLIVEFLFDYPGLGHLTITAVFQRDFPLIQAITLITGATLVLVNILVDLAASLIDPRLGY